MREMPLVIRGSVARHEMLLVIRGCVETSCLCVSINENRLEISIYPNPSTNSFNIETTLSVATPIQSEIKYTLGQTVYAFNENAMSGLYKKTIDLKSWTRNLLLDFADQ